MTLLPELSPKIILGVAAHPDDLDFGMGGSIAAWVTQGATAYYLILTNGNKGSEADVSPNQLRDERRDEQRKAAAILGVKEVFFCNYDDCELSCQDDVKCDIARVIRRLKPDVVMTLDPTMLYSAEYGIINHPDHRAAGQATLDAVYPLARDRLAFPKLTAEGLAPHKVKTVLLANLNDRNYCVDITDTIDIKIKALQAHQSQFSNKPDAIDLLRKINQADGKHIGTAYAEGFVRIDIS